MVPGTTTPSWCQVRLGVTTSLKASGALKARAEQRAAEWGLPYFERRKLGMFAVFEHVDAALIFAAKGVYVATADGQLRPHLSTAAIRLRHIAAGESDPLIRAGDLGPGDHVIDCTYGLGRDAVVAAHIVGNTGSIIGLEASTALFHMANENRPLAEFDGAIDIEPAAIELVHADARTWLAEAAPDSSDVVLIDPMFENPKTSDASFSLLRLLADETPLDEAWVRSAQRVARRCVVVKTGRWAPWFDEVGLVEVHSHSNARWYRAPAVSKETEAP